MYPRNSATPPRIAIGAVVQISDGAVQTSGCTVRVIEEGGAEGDGAGTTAYSTDGAVLYTPTQGETDQTTFILIAKKTGCIPVAQTIVTTAASVAGKVQLDTDQAVNVTKVNGTAQTAGDLTALITTVDDLLDTEVGALTTELAKVPKSDGTATWNATALASLQAEAADALNAYDPPTNTELNTAIGLVTTKTDNLPDDPADESLIIAATDAIASAVAALPQDKTGYTIAAGGIPVGGFAAGAITDAATAADAEAAIAAAVLAGIVEAQGSYTLKQAMSICLAVLAGVTADGGATIKTPNGTATRVAATVNGSNERSAMVLSP